MEKIVLISNYDENINWWLFPIYGKIVQYGKMFQTTDQVNGEHWVRNGEWHWMRLDDDKGIKDSFNSFTHAPKKNMKQWIWGCILCSWQKRPFFCMEAGDPIEIQPEMWSFGPVSNFDYPNTCFCNSYIRLYIAIRDAKISPCFGSSNNSLTMKQIHPVPSSPDPPDLQVAVQVQELPHRHGVMLSAASGLAVGPGGSSPVLSTNLFIIKPGGILNSKVGKCGDNCNPKAPRSKSSATFHPLPIVGKWLPLFGLEIGHVTSIFAPIYPPKRTWRGRGAAISSKSLSPII